MMSPKDYFQLIRERKEALLYNPNQDPNYNYFPAFNKAQVAVFFRNLSIWCEKRRISMKNASLNYFPTPLSHPTKSHQQHIFCCCVASLHQCGFVKVFPFVGNKTISTATAVVACST